MVVYIIYSAALDKFYIGQTEEFEGRLIKHLLNTDKTSFTSRADDWEEYLLIPCENRTQALQIENYIKKQKSRKYNEGLKENPTWVENLLKRFST